LAAVEGNAKITITADTSKAEQALLTFEKNTSRILEDLSVDRKLLGSRDTQKLLPSDAVDKYIDPKVIKSFLDYSEALDRIGEGFKKVNSRSRKFVMSDTVFKKPGTISAGQDKRVQPMLPAPNRSDELRSRLNAIDQDLSKKFTPELFREFKEVKYLVKQYESRMKASAGQLYRPPKSERYDPNAIAEAASLISEGQKNAQLKAPDSQSLLPAPELTDELQQRMDDFELEASKWFSPELIKKFKTFSEMNPLPYDYETRVKDILGKGMRDFGKDAGDLPPPSRDGQKLLPEPPRDWVFGNPPDPPFDYLDSAFKKHLDSMRKKQEDMDEVERLLFPKRQLVPWDDERGMEQWRGRGGTRVTKEGVVDPEVMAGKTWGEQVQAYQEMQLTDPSSKEFAKAQTQGAKGVEMIGKAVKKNYAPMLKMYDNLGDKTKFFARGTSELWNKGAGLDKKSKGLFEAGRNLGFAGFVLQVTFQNVNKMVTQLVGSIVGLVRQLGSVDASFGWLESTMSSLALADAPDAWFDAAIEGFEGYFDASSKFEGEMAKLKVLLQPFINILVDVGARGLKEIVDMIIALGGAESVINGIKKTNFEWWLQSVLEAAIIMKNALVESFSYFASILANPAAFKKMITGLASLVGGFVKGMASSIKTQLEWLIWTANIGGNALLDSIGQKIGWWFSQLERLGMMLTILGSTGQTAGFFLQSFGQVLKLAGETIFRVFLTNLLNTKTAVDSVSTAVRVGTTSFGDWTSSAPLVVAANTKITASVLTLRAALLGIGLALAIVTVAWASWEAIMNPGKWLQGATGKNVFQYYDDAGNIQTRTVKPGAETKAFKEEMAADKGMYGMGPKEGRGYWVAGGAKELEPELTPLQLAIKQIEDEISAMEQKTSFLTDKTYVDIVAKRDALVKKQFEESMGGVAQPDFDWNLPDTTMGPGMAGVFNGPAGSTLLSKNKLAATSTAPSKTVVTSSASTVPNATVVPSASTMPTPKSTTAEQDALTTLINSIVEAIKEGFLDVQVNQSVTVDSDINIADFTGSVADLDYVVEQVNKQIGVSTLRLGIGGGGLRGNR